MKHVRFQSPDLSHANAIADLVQGSSRLDKNSNYTYALWCTHFSSCSAVAVRDNEVIAFLTAFRSPEKPESYFLWQTATKPRHGVPALGIDLVEFAVKREISRGARFVEASVDKENKPIRMVMKTLCKRLSGHLSEELLFPAELVSSGDTEHHDETLMRISLPTTN
ncbi:GNAT family N-acetyltransferase [Rhizobium gallicum]|nr:GNAT family N-acetyltransferase [Rhizobium gallicum]